MWDAYNMDDFNGINDANNANQQASSVDPLRMNDNTISSPLSAVQTDSYTVQSEQQPLQQPIQVIQPESPEPIQLSGNQSYNGNLLQKLKERWQNRPRKKIARPVFLGTLSLGIIMIIVGLIISFSAK